LNWIKRLEEVSIFIFNGEFQKDVKRQVLLSGLLCALLILELAVYASIWYSGCWIFVDGCQRWHWCSAWWGDSEKGRVGIGGKF
jgi:hypothetical protein